MSRRPPAFGLLLALLLWAAVGQAARAHGGRHERHQPAPAGPRNWGELARAWAVEPLVVIPLLLSAWVYARGLRRMWREAGAGRGVRTWEAACFAGGWLALALALVSPLHPWGNVLFSVHMTQHEVLMLVAAPLLVLGKPVVASLKALPPGGARQALRRTGPAWVRRSWQALTNPLVAWLIHLVVLWAWHLPALFHAALESELVHALQHLSFLLSALLFWWALLGGRQGALGYGVAVLYVFTTALHSGLLGALITLAATVWYPDYLGRTEAWGLTPLEDQQLGGLVMWVPACSVYIVAGLALFAGWLKAAEERARHREAAAAWGPEVPTP